MCIAVRVLPYIYLLLLYPNPIDLWQPGTAYLHVFQDKQNLAILLTRAIELHQVLIKAQHLPHLQLLYICTVVVKAEHFPQVQNGHSPEGPCNITCWVGKAGLDLAHTPVRYVSDWV